MKKNLSLILILCMILSVIAEINVDAANYSTGTVLDFDKVGITTSLPSGVHIQTDGYYGNVLNWDTRAVATMIDFSDVSKDVLTSGKHILSFDVKQVETTDKLALFLLDYDEASDSFKQKLAFEQRLGDFVFTPNSGTNYIPVDGGKWTAGAWTRYDIVFDYDADTATLYTNGVQGGTISIAADKYDSSTPANSSVQIDGFNKIQVMGTTHDGGGDLDTCFDNFCYRPYSAKSFNAEISGGKDEVVIKFDETAANLTAENFTVKKKVNPLVAEESVDFTIKESCGAYTVLKLSEDMVAGAKYIVELKDVISLFGNPLSVSTLIFFNNQTEVTSLTDDMSAYEKDAFTDASVDTMWTNSHWTTSGNATQSAIDYTTAADGVVTLKGGTDTDKLLRYNFKDIALDEGVIEIEATVNITFDSSLSGSTAVVYYNLQDKDGTYKIGEFQANGFMAAASTTADTRSITTAKDTGYVYGSDNVIKTVIDLSSKKIATSVNDGDPIVYNYICGDSSTTYSNNLTDVSIVSFNVLKNTSVEVKIDSIKATKTVYNTAVSDISFTDIYGTKTNAANVSSATNKISVTYPGGMYNDTFNGTFVLNDGTEDIGGTGSYNAETGVYTFEMNKLLGANKTYTLTLKDSIAADGSAYKEITGSFTTGNAVKDISIMNAVKTETGATVIMNAVNSGKAATCYIITAGYKNDSLAKCMIEVLEIDPEYTGKTKSFEYADATLAGCDLIKAFVWNDISQTLMPVEN